MENFEEQPIQTECNSLENSKLVDGTDDNGSSLGKFKNSDELLKAYMSLEKEFTKKCQKIKQLEAQNDNATNSPKIIDNEQVVPNGVQQTDLGGQNANLSIKDMLINATKTAAIDSLYQVAGGDAVNYQKEQEVALTEELKASILSDVNLRNKFIENYLNEIQSQKTAPLMVNSNASNFCVMPKTKPQSLQDAGDIAKEMLKN